jgi:hypothetical protein
MEGRGHKYVTSGPAAFSVKLPDRTGVYAMDAVNWSNLKPGSRLPICGRRSGDAHSGGRSRATRRHLVHRDRVGSGPNDQI